MLTKNYGSQDRSTLLLNQGACAAEGRETLENNGDPDGERAGSPQRRMTQQKAGGNRPLTMGEQR